MKPPVKSVQNLVPNYCAHRADSGPRELNQCAVLKEQFDRIVRPAIETQ